MSKAIAGARIVLGLIFFVFGLNGFLQFLPQPPMEGGAAAMEVEELKSLLTQLCVRKTYVCHLDVKLLKSFGR